MSRGLLRAYLCEALGGLLRMVSNWTNLDLQTGYSFKGL